VERLSYVLASRLLDEILDEQVVHRVFVRQLVFSFIRGILRQGRTHTLTRQVVNTMLKTSSDHPHLAFPVFEARQRSHVLETRGDPVNLTS
jgi:hypothetical protein